MKNIIILVFASLVVFLGYTTYLDSQAKKREQVNQVITDAEHSLKALENNPNYNQRSSLYRMHHNENIIH